MRVAEDPDGRVVEKSSSAERNMEGDEVARLLSSSPSNATDPATFSKLESGKTKSPSSSVVSRTGLLVLILLAVQNCSKNLLMRYVMKDRPKFLTSAAVLGSEFIKLSLSTSYILLVEHKSAHSILQFLMDDRRNTLLLTVPASAYNLQMSLEYVALANLNAAVFSVLVQTKLLFTATFAAAVLRKKLKYIQVISLVLLTSGVMLCNLSNAKDGSSSSSSSVDTIKGVTATLGIALSSGFASVYTEKVIKAQGSSAGKRPVQSDGREYGLAYTQVQLSLMSLVTIGIYACMMDFTQIVEKGLFHNFTFGAFLSVFSSAIGGLIVAAVLKYADSVLKGYATAMSVILTGVLSMFLFGTTLTTIYFMGIINVVAAVLLYNGKDLEQYVC
jgi:UDP-sugar transporter A1/2/3